MKLHKIPTTLATALALQALTTAQTPEFVVVVKVQQFEQTSATQIAHIPGLPFGCELAVEDEPTLSPDPSVSGPISVGEPFHNGGVLGFNSDSEQWGYGSPNFDGYGTQTLAELDALFGSGVYTFDVAGVKVPLNLTGDAWASSAPLLSLTGGYWDGGLYYVEEGQALTITTNVFTEFGTHAEDFVWMDFDGCDYTVEVESIASAGGMNFITLTVPAGSLTAGNIYDVDTGFAAASDYVSSIPGLPSAEAAAAYEMVSALQVLAVPDGGLLGTRYCSPSVPNSSGFPACMFVGGSQLVADNDVTLVANQLPEHQFGYFLISQTQKFVPNPGGSQGNLCLGGKIGRYSRSGEVLSSGACRSFSLALDLANTPSPNGPISILAGETWNFTAWYRDKNPKTTSNFTDAISVTFQ